jgi:HAD superfamily hydrolase (TIGR01549 family)
MSQSAQQPEGPADGPQVEAVFFDVNDTLWDSRGCAYHVMEILLPRFTPPLPQVDVDEVVRRFNAVFLDLPRRAHLRERRAFSRLRRFEALLENYDVHKRGLARDLSHTYDSVRRLVMRQFLRADAHRVLVELERRGMQRGVIMNGSPAIQRHLVQSLGLAPHLNHVVLGQIEGYSKPDVRLFKRALQLAGVEPDRALYVGDSPLTDLLGASRAGIPAIWFNTGRRRLPRGWPAPDFTISSLSEILSIAES